MSQITTTEAGSPQKIRVHVDDIDDIEFYDDITVDVSQLVTEDDTPVDNFFSAKLQRLLVEILYSSWKSAIAPRTFLADANVGIFYTNYKKPVVPDVLLSLDVEVPDDFHTKEKRSYYIWEFGKPPNVAIEIVSNKKGNELSSKLHDYAQMGVAYYAVFDPLQQLGDCVLQVYGLHEGAYVELEAEVEPPLFWLEQVGIGLRLWEGKYEEKQDVWLRWCDRQGNLFATGAERAAQAEMKAAQLAERLRAMGVNPDEL